MKNIISVLVILAFLAGCSGNMEQEQSMAVSGGRIIRIDSFPSNFIAPRNIDIWLPENYGKGRKFAVLYMHDGQMLYDSSSTWNGQEWGVDENMSLLLDQEKIRPCIVVGIWNSGSTRKSDYFPQKPWETLPESYRDSLITHGMHYGNRLFAEDVQSDNYLRFIVEELKPYIDENYHSLPGRENTFIMGSSMGGLISMYAICEYPEIFGGAACLSTHWTGIYTNLDNPIPGAFIDYLASHLPDPGKHLLYFDHGTETLDSLYGPYQVMADSVIRQGGYDSTNFFTKVFPGTNHSEQAWNNRLQIPMRFLLKNP